MALSGLLLAAPIAVTGFAGGALAVAATRAFYAWELRKATEEMEDMLRAIENTLRSRSLFDADPPTLPPPASSGNDAAFIASIT
jgi:hypothetical protein